MKPSGIEWLGEIPAHWETTPLKHTAKFVNGFVFKPSEWTDSGIPIIRIQNLNGANEFNYFEGKVPKKYHVEQGDLLFGWSGNRGTSFGPFLWHRQGLHYLNQHIFKITDLTAHRYWFYWMLCGVTKYVEQQAHGIIGMVHITSSNLGNISIPKIATDEQHAIAAFLDRETAKIDALIAAKAQFIALLQEQRSAIISHAVTKGLNPDAPMQDSGIEWLGEIPAGWEVVRLKFLAQMRGGGTPSKSNPDFWAGDIPWVSPKDMKIEWLDTAEDKITIEAIQESATTLIQPSSVLLVVRSGILQHSLPIAINTVPVTLNQDMKALSPVDWVDAKFLAWMLRGNAKTILIICHQVGATVDSLRMEYFQNMMFAIPPLAEQRTIAAFLDGETANIDELIQKTQDTVTLLQEQRTALISAAVTGKIDVRLAV
jgi:type I restriction enzyme S subunit